MAHPHLRQVRAAFRARVQRHKNRLVAIPAAVQRELGLDRRPNNRIVLVSIRRADGGRWNHHYFKLTADNEFAIPADVVHLGPGDDVEVKIRRVIEDVEAALPGYSGASGGQVLLRLDERERAGWRRDGSQRLDEYLAAEMDEEEMDEPGRDAGRGA